MKQGNKIGTLIVYQDGYTLTLNSQEPALAQGLEAAGWSPVTPGLWTCPRAHGPLQFALELLGLVPSEKVQEKALALVTDGDEINLSIQGPFTPANHKAAVDLATLFAQGLGRERESFIFHGLEVEAFLSEADGTPCVQIDTPGVPDNEEREPACRIYLNDFSMHEGVPYPEDAEIE